MPSIVANIKLSGKPFVPEVTDRFPDGGARTPIGLLELEKITVQLEQYRSMYHNYWESAMKQTNTG
jgi:amidase